MIWIECSREVDVQEIFKNIGIGRDTQIRQFECIGLEVVTAIDGKIIQQHYFPGERILRSLYFHFNVVTNSKTEGATVAQARSSINKSLVTILINFSAGFVNKNLEVFPIF